MDGKNKTLIISNRLPVRISYTREGITYKASEGGLATGLGSLDRQQHLWIGWPGIEIPESDKKQVTGELLAQHLLPVFLNRDEIIEYYEGFSNETIWPLFHYFPTFASYQPNHWEAYVRVNRKFADEILRVADRDDTIWIHDYQLMLVPQMVREALPEARIAFFNHIPFPSYEIFRLIPWRRELLQGLTGADVIGFQTYDDVRHFISASNRILNISGMTNELPVDNRMVTVDAFPISIDYTQYYRMAESSQTRRNEKRLRKLIGHNKLILSIDRLDYSKGILHRLRAFRMLLERHPELRGRVTHIQLVVPSRDNVPKYRELKEETERMVSEINGSYGTLGWQPVQHFYRAFPPHVLSALYKTADVALVTPMRDGMNLVSKEYIASRKDQKGVLVLSEMAGAARELSEALIINPNDIWHFCETIFLALHMPEEEQKRRISAMQQTVATFDIHNWVRQIMDRLERVKNRQQSMLTRHINASVMQKIAVRYHFASRRLILLDYDGTLVPFRNDAREAVPDAGLTGLLKELTDDPQNRVVIVSGRDYQTLERWLGGQDLEIIAEHGAWVRHRNKPWHSRQDGGGEWKPEVRNIMNLYVHRTPGALIEEKSLSLAWHYRKSEAGLGQLRAHELAEDLSHIISGRGLQILEGDKVIEVKSMAVNKGLAALSWLKQDAYDFIIAIGDDYTDEDTFRAMPADAITIKVGNGISAATYFLKSWEDVRALLLQLSHSGQEAGHSAGSGTPAVTG